MNRIAVAAAKILQMLEERVDPVPAWKLSYAAGFEGDRTHRDTRRAVAHLTHFGYPVVHVHGRGYRLARTPAEVREYVAKLDETARACRERADRAARYAKLYTGREYLGRIHGRHGMLLEWQART